MSAISNIKKKGFHVYKSLFSSKLIEKLKKVVEAQHPSPQAGFFKNEKLDSKAVLNLQSKHPIFIELLKKEIFNKINKNLLNDKYYKSLKSNQPNYILSQYAARSAGEKKLVWHIDDKVPNKSNNPNYIQWAIPLIDLDETNGCTQLIPKSHLTGVLKPKVTKKDKVINLKLKKGDVAVWDGRIWHSAKRNKSKSDRWVIIITFCKWFFKPHYDIPRNFPKKFYKNLNENLKIILGFASIPKLDEKSGVVQRGSLKSANKFISKGLF